MRHECLSLLQQIFFFQTHKMKATGFFMRGILIELLGLAVVGMDFLEQFKG